MLWKLTGAGHVWPGGKQKVLERILGPSTDIIDANREMWTFFKRLRAVKTRQGSNRSICSSGFYPTIYA